MPKRMLSVLLTLVLSLMIIGCATSASISSPTSIPSNISEQTTVNPVGFSVSPSPQPERTVETVETSPVPLVSDPSPAMKNTPTPTQTPTGLTLRQYKNMMYFYSISYPSEWIVDEDVIYAVLIDDPLNQTSKFVMKSQIVIEIEKVEVSSTASQFLDLIKNKRSASPFFKNWKVTSSQKITSGTNKGGYRIEYSYIENTENKSGIGIAVKKGGYGYYAHFEVIDSEWELWKNTANACLDSFTTPNVVTGSYSDSSLRYSLTLPDGWSAIESSIPERPISISPPVNQPVVVGMVNIDKIPAGTTVHQYLFAVLLSALKDNSTIIIQEGEFSFANGRSGYEIQLSTLMGAEAWKIRLIAVTDKDRAIRLMFTGVAANQDSQLDTITKIARSLDLQ